MIEKVQTIWITGFLRHSLVNDARVILGLSERPDAVARPLDLLVRRPEQGDRPLPPETDVVDVFDSMDRSLLILGAPGAGKTTLLLELARDLLDRARTDPVRAIPVVFPLSTWGQSRKPLVDWLQDELSLRYDVPQAIAQEWVASDQIIPLLDGLDEVKADQRAACVETINAYRQSHGFLPLVITSRTDDYDSLAKPLRLQGAIVVQPLAREQVDAYLTDLGPAGENVRAALREDSSLWEMLDSPLLLNVVTVAYAGQQEAPSPMRGTVAERRDHLFGLYVNTTLQRRAAEQRCSSEQTVRWLSWLATEMARHSQTVFYLERLERDWLPESQRAAVGGWENRIVGLVVGVVGGLIGGLFGVLAEGLFFGLFNGLIGALIFGLAFGLASPGEVARAETVGWSWAGPARIGQSMSRSEELVRALVSGLAGGLVAGLVLGLAIGLAFGLVIGLVSGLLWPLYVALGGGLSYGEIETRSFPNEGIHRSAQNACIVGLVAGSLVALVSGLGIGVVGGLGFGLVGALEDALVGGLEVGLMMGLFVGRQWGGEACLQHLVFRLALIRNRSTPWNYVRFLDYAAERILLRKVGGGYAFIHRTLLEYFAERDGGPAE
jgi:hypothetical protein